jgi:CDP-6-deoxy-D-xylo-4-hexulose-3-dehydrase
MISKKLKNNKIVVPSLSWVTTVSPIMQFGLTPIMCDTCQYTLGIDVEHFEQICKDQSPSAVIIVHALGFPNKMKEIIDICDRYGVILLEDSCESVGSKYEGKNTGTIGLMGSFSTYYGHHFSTIEGGIICTDDQELYNILLSIRSHGWSRDLEESERIKLQMKYNISDFDNMYTFYYPGFNLRSTDLQAYIGINQIDRLNQFVISRNRNLSYYDKHLNNSYWKINLGEFEFVSNFAYPVISPHRDKIIKKLYESGVETRPLICGNMANQPFFKNIYGHVDGLTFANTIHKYGFYLPNNPDMIESDIKHICSIVNEFST